MTISVLVHSTWPGHTRLGQYNTNVESTSQVILTYSPPQRGVASVFVFARSRCCLKEKCTKLSSEQQLAISTFLCFIQQPPVGEWLMTSLSPPEPCFIPGRLNHTRYCHRPATIATSPRSYVAQALIRGNGFRCPLWRNSASIMKI